MKTTRNGPVIAARIPVSVHGTLLQIAEEHQSNLSSAVRYVLVAGLHALAKTKEMPQRKGKEE